MLKRILDQAALEQITIDTTDASITDVATALLRRAHWTGDERHAS